MSHWQYLAHVEPVLPTPRTGAPAQIRTELPDLPPRRAAFIFAVFAAVSTFVPNPTPAAVVADWRPQMAEPVRQAARVVTFDTGAERSISTERGTRLAWQPALDTPLWRLSPAVSFETGAERPLSTERGTRLTWQPALDTPPRSQEPPASLETGAERPTSTERGPGVSWMPALDSPVRTLQQAVSYATGAEWVRVAPPVSVPPLDWLVEFTLPIWPVRFVPPFMGECPRAGVVVSAADYLVLVAADDAVMKMPADDRVVRAPADDTTGEIVADDGTVRMPADDTTEEM